MTAHTVKDWHKRYLGGWTNEIVPEAFSHRPSLPAAYAEAGESAVEIDTQIDYEVVLVTRKTDS